MGQQSTFDELKSTVADSEAHQLSEDHQPESMGLVYGLGTFAYYAIPDFVSSRPLRAALKAGALGVILATDLHRQPVDLWDDSDSNDAVSDGSPDDAGHGDDVGAETTDATAAHGAADAPQAAESTTPSDGTAGDKYNPTPLSAGSAPRFSDADYDDNPSNVDGQFGQGGHLAPEGSKTSTILFAAAGAGIAAVSTGLIIVTEKYIYNRAEKQRRAGKSFAHTKQGLALGLLTGGTMWAVEKFAPFDKVMDR